MRSNNHINVVSFGRKIVRGDAYVMAFGSYSTAMLKKVVSIRVYPLKRYSLTIPLEDKQDAPVSTLLDKTYKVAITRFDRRIRLGGMAEIAGFNSELYRAAVETPVDPRRP